MANVRDRAKVIARARANAVRVGLREGYGWI